MAKVHDDVTMAKVQVLQSLGDALGQKQMQVPNASTKDEDELFGELIASQMRQLLPEEGKRWSKCKFRIFCTRKC